VDSFFENSKLNLKTLTSLLFFWAHEIPVKTIVPWLKISKDSVVQWFQYFREVCSQKLIKNPIYFGGENNVVQLDESKFLKLKHNRGFATNNLREKIWVFGAYCMKNKMIYL
ncbi:hypothetical protein H311_01669, partial [Anncaliia algerae PRA109]